MFVHGCKQIGKRYAFRPVTVHMVARNFRRESVVYTSNITRFPFRRLANSVRLRLQYERNYNRISPSYSTGLDGDVYT